MTARLLTAAVLLCGLAAPALAAPPAVQNVANPTSAAVPDARAAVKQTEAATAPGTGDAAAPAASPSTAPAAIPNVPEMTPPATQAQLPAPAARPVQPMQSPTAGTSAGNLLQTIFALVLVLGLMFALAWFMKRYGPKAAAGPANLHLVGALNLGGRERIMVVEVGDQWIVVGASPGRVNALATLPKQHIPEQAALLQAGAHPGGGGFADWLKQTIDKRNAK